MQQPLTLSRGNLNVDTGHSGGMDAYSRECFPGRLKTKLKGTCVTHFKLYSVCRRLDAPELGERERWRERERERERERGYLG